MRVRTRGCPGERVRLRWERVRREMFAPDFEHPTLDTRQPLLTGNLNSSAISLPPWYPASHADLSFPRSLCCKTQEWGVPLRRTWVAVYPLCHHSDLFCSRERTRSRPFAYSRVFGISVYFPRTTTVAQSSWLRTSSASTHTRGFSRIHSIFRPSVEKQHKRSTSKTK